MSSRPCGFACVVAAVLLGSELAVGLPGQEVLTGNSPHASLGDVRPQNPGFLVQASVDRESLAYYEGDTLSIQVCTEADAFVYVLYQQADGKIFQVFPNVHQPNNRVRARRVVRIPASDDLFRWVVGRPFGKEAIVVFASDKPVETFSGGASPQRFFTTVLSRQIGRLAAELGDDARSTFAKHTVHITTYPADVAVQTRRAGRFGVFFGIRTLEFRDEFRELFPESDAVKGNCPLDQDAQAVAAVFRERGQLDDLRVYINQQATRQVFEDAITRWLPGRSRPGDTVFIHFAGMSVSLVQGGADEVYLWPYDFLAPPVLEMLMKKDQEGRLDPHLSARVRAWHAFCLRHASAQDAGRGLLSATGIPTTVLLSWLQALSGRQVVLLFNTQYGAAGFAPDQKGILEGARLSPGTFGPQLGRLKDIGQREIALLSSSPPAQTPFWLVTAGKPAVFTLGLEYAFQHTHGCLTIEKAQEEMTGLIQEFLTDSNRQRQAAGKKPVAIESVRPYLVNHCTRPVILRP